MPNCRDCHEPIKFARIAGRTIPLDQVDTFTGSFVLYHEGGILRARPARLPQDYSRPRHSPHFDTCPKRRYRKDRR